MSKQQLTAEQQEQINLLAELEVLKRENTMLKTKTSTIGGLKISAKGALSVYGMGRFPTTLYKSQWIQLLDRKEELLAFINANDLSLVSKVKE
jgi:hypothetical protein